ncbi:hypothetical protein MPSEU_000472600 [Mayamaea pseudoterrestris]|nr:hypothetical protein MPSEU_000472600 [Mayamaea pseudoterrestris]
MNTTAALSHDACITNGQCLNGGTCASADEHSAYRHCECPDGFTGLRCQDFCPLDCQNNGVCQSTSTSNRIEDYIHDSNKRSSSINNFTCKCKGYFTGKLCQTRYVNCGGHQCFNGAKCAAIESAGVGKWCECADGYSGDLCQSRAAFDESIKKKANASGAVMGVVIVTTIFVIICWRRRTRQDKRLCSQHTFEERQNLHVSVPREERDDWECRNIV